MPNMLRYYTGIGSRKTPPEIQKFMTQIAQFLGARNYVLRSGGAHGADKAFEKGAEDQQIFTTWSHLPFWTEAFVDYFHPTPKKLNPYVRKLMKRNAMQILGTNGDSLSSFVVCWTEDGKASGGTGQSLRIAEYYNVPIYNLYFQEMRDKMENRMTTQIFHEEQERVYHNG